MTPFDRSQYPELILATNSTMTTSEVRFPCQLQYLLVPSFKLETEEIIKNSVRKDAFFYVPIHKILNMYYGCTQSNLSVQSTAIRVCNSTLEFTQIVKEAKLILQSHGIRVHEYMNDWLLRANTRHQCRLRTKELIQTIQLCFVINFEKSELEPTQKSTF